MTAGDHNPTASRIALLLIRLFVTRFPEGEHDDR